MSIQGSTDSFTNLQNENRQLWEQYFSFPGFIHQLIAHLEKELISENKNVVTVSLSNRLLRSDTAVIVALFCIQELVNE